MRKLILLSLIFVFLQNISAQTRGTVKWEFDTGGNVRNSPVIGSDGTIYIGSDKLYAFNPDGSTKWDIDIDNGTDPPVIGADGTIYIAGSAINPDGTKEWEFEYGGIPSAIGTDGTIYTYSNKFHAINPDGTLKWKFEAGYEKFGRSVIGADGIIYVWSGFCYWGCYGSLLAVNPDGTGKWEFEIGEEGVPSPAIGSDGTVYFGLRDSLLYAINPDGTKKWTFQTGGSSSSPAIGPDGTIYIGSNDSTFYAVKPDGTKKWAFEIGSSSSSPAIGSDGTIYLGSNDSTFYAVNPDGTEKWSFETGGSIKSSPAIGPDGTVYFGSADGKLYALYTESTGLADSPWPKFRKNYQNQAGNYNQNCPRAKAADIFISIKNGGLVKLDGSLSYDPDGEPMSYLWRITEKPEGSPIVLSDSTSAVINVNIPNGFRGTYSFSLRVADNDDGTSWAAIQVSTEKKWSLKTNSSLTYSPVIGPDGTIYLEGMVIGEDHTSHWYRHFAISPDGKLEWEIDGQGPLVIGSDGVVYVGRQNSLCALKPDGTQKWVFQTNGYVLSPAIGSDGTIYIGSNDSIFYAINPDGTEKWQFYADCGARASIVGSDGTVYFGSEKGLFAINSDGTKKWQSQIRTYVYLPPAIDSDGTIFVITSDSLFYAISPNGLTKWEFRTKGHFRTSPVIGTDGTIYICSSDSVFYALNPDGTVKWESEHDINYPTIGANGIIYGNSSYKLYAINPDGSIKWDYNHGSWRSSLAIDSDGTIYTGSGDGKLHAVYSNSNGLANSPWPKYMHDNRNTGNAQTPLPVKEDKTEIPKRYALYPMYPNPFNPVTHIKFSLPKAGRAKIYVYNILGQKVVRLLDAKKIAGIYEVIWNASHFSSGMYFICFESGSFVKVRKCLLIK